MTQIEETLIAAIESSGQSRYKIAQGSGVSEGVLSRFVNRQRSITIETAERLAAYLELTIDIHPAGKSGRKRKGR
ncbi:MAG: XRE family transcriptional regulator [Planctomycetes bacterium]|nr:XRE family transcriptional regulator [Planctomycetota bacterium]NOG54447.1 helix-turn-helix transcriptional regulator [Planctomycetota bacterium]